MESRLIAFAKHRNLPFRIFFIILLLVPLLYFTHFSYRFYVYLTGSVLTDVITQQWHIVVLNIMVFAAFLIPLSFRRKADWREYGLVSAFFISLFVEMYGIPLTILFASTYFFTAGAPLPATIVGFEFLGVDIGMDLGMTYGAILIVIGMAVILTGWITLYRNIKKRGLVKKGIYAYSRHPQYLGFILIIWGWFVAWPTILTLVFTPIIIYKYIQLSKTEEREISEKLPEYQEYMGRTPFLI